MRPWTAVARERYGRVICASMGPRPCGRGRPPVGGGGVAAVRLQWGHGLAAVDGGRHGRPVCDDCMLQWGHGLAAVDGPIMVVSVPARALLQWGHGLAAVDGRPPRRHCAARYGRLQWGHGLAAVDGRLAPLCARPSIVLQWGHGLAAVDGQPTRRGLARSGRASMGPRPCGRGRLVPLRTGRRARRASMGPRPCGRGRPVIDTIDYRENGLQWGHGLAAVDGALGLGPAGRRPGFNGATALRPWTGGEVGLSEIDLVMLQWGHGLAAVDGGAGSLACTSGFRASMGPRPCGRGR